MKISPISSRYYFQTNKQVNFTQNKEKKKSSLDSDKLLKLWAASALTSLAIAYAGVKIILKDYKENINEILDKYEQELKVIEHKTDSFNNVFEIENYDNVPIEP